ncbi:BCS1 N terminal-domain-containing protein [Microdochium trichocladiopsis]|uniref:BCS1 N terminal-domain-containing protein n=1 Tax=Microdochium trichocladiopsis TaxID=1682393 RepID=A0A9P9BNL9_9PEZI|nr:BCS1 N terminal-domain-containing protein [Microdochium trichocladiopsis]KAH7027878.1 BCS1 N terminal-domain-containing protein [Microdochium trichocladiopsis]
MPEPTQAPQLALLDFFFPGFSVFAAAVQKYLKIDLNLYIPLVLMAGALMAAWNYISQFLWDSLESHFMSVVDIRTDDEIYNILMAWVSNQRFAQKSRRFVVNTNLNSRSWFLFRWDEEEEEEEYEHGGQTSDLKKKKKALNYTPSFGSHVFFYKRNLLIFRRTSNRETGGYMMVSEKEEISISCFGRNPAILKELLLEAREQYMERDEKKTLIYRGTTRAGSTEPTWQRCMARASRPFSTVILNEKTKQDLIDDVTDYLNPATQRWYANRGIPYRRGYLLWGPPGTGKSSLSLALAGFFKMRIYIVSLSSVSATEENLATLFAELPRRCVVLLEDIDSAGLTHTREQQGVPQPAEAEKSDKDDMVPGQLTTGTGPTNNSTGRLSLSGLLNILDGVASQEGRVLIMTTNHLEKLDKALIRPGRVDMTVEFGLADRGMIAAIFRAIFAPLEGDDGPAPLDHLGLDASGKQAYLDKKQVEKQEKEQLVDELADKFSEKVPAFEFSPAELQGFLMRHKRDARAAIDNVEEFIEQTRKDRKEKELKAAEDKRKAEEEAAKKKKKDEEEEAQKKKEQEEKEQKEKSEKDKAGKEQTADKKDEAKKGNEEDKTSASTTDKTEDKKEAEASDLLKPVVSSGHKRTDSGYVTPDSE